MGQPVHNILLSLKTAEPKLVYSCCLQFSEFEKKLIIFVEYLLHFYRKFHNGDI